MRSSKVYETLDGLSKGTEMKYRLVPDLIRLGLVRKVPQTEDSTAEFEGLKVELKNVKKKIRSLRKKGIDAQSGCEQSGMKMKELQGQEIDLRRRILDMVRNMRPTGVVETSRGDVILTYNGREALQLLEARMPAASDLRWETLANNVEKFNEHLASEAIEASTILKQISPRLKTIDEYLLRSAAVGLASIDGDAEQKARKFIDHIAEFKNIMGSDDDDTFVVLGAEEAVTQEMQNKLPDKDIFADFSTLLSELAHTSRLTPEHKAVATLLMSKPHKERSELLSRIKSETPSNGSVLGAALILLESTENTNIDASSTRYESWMRKLNKASRGDPNDAIVASALMATATGEQNVIEEKFDRARAYMEDLFSEKMLTASATIAIWPTNVEESFDNIRLAASQILLKKLSVGGVENFSLGMKLLTNNAEFIDTGMGSAIGLARDAGTAGRVKISGAMTEAAGATAVALLASPLLVRTPFTVFHALTIQKNAVQDFRFHPVHTSYLYG